MVDMEQMFLTELVMKENPVTKEILEKTPGGISPLNSQILSTTI